MTEQLPAPLVGREVDLRGLSFMPLDVQRLLDSELWMIGTGEECKAAVSLWCKAWMQHPAASLPDNDKLLAVFSGAGPRWKKVKARALHGFKKCSDGRLYHPVIVEKALEAWAERLGYRERTRRANEERKRRQEEREQLEREKHDGERHDKRNVGRNVERNDPRDEQRNVERDVQREHSAPRNVTSSKGREGTVERREGTVESPLPPRHVNGTKAVSANTPPVGAIPWTEGGSMPNGTPEGAYIVWSYHKMIEEFWGPDPPPWLPPKDVSIAQAWVEHGAEYEPVRQLMEDRMRQMAERKERPPSSLRYFDNPVAQLSGRAA